MQPLPFPWSGGGRDKGYPRTFQPPPAEYLAALQAAQPQQVGSVQRVGGPVGQSRNYPADLYSRDLEHAMARQIPVGEVGIAIGSTVAGLELISISLQETAIAIGATAAATVAAPPGIALLLAPAGALVATASVSVAVGGAALAGFGLENVIRFVNMQTGSTLPTPNQFFRREIFPVLPSMRTGGPLDRAARR